MVVGQNIPVGTDDDTGSQPMLEERAVFWRALSIAVAEELPKEGIIEEGGLLRRVNPARGTDGYHRGCDPVHDLRVGLARRDDRGQRRWGLRNRRRSG